MRSCADVGNALSELAALAPEDLPAAVREHLAECVACARTLWARRAMQQTIEALLRQRKDTRRGM